MARRPCIYVHDPVEYPLGCWDLLVVMCGGSRPWRRVRSPAFANLFNRLFPERQLYHRSHGQVRFVSMSAQTQIALLIVTLAFLSWVAYASVNVVFKEQIISAKERNLVAMQANYEVRLAEAQDAYERLHTFLIQAEDRFQRETELLR